jgi:peptidyl-prolyl cis-trans isomerase C
MKAMLTRAAALAVMAAFGFVSGTYAQDKAEKPAAAKKETAPAAAKPAATEEATLSPEAPIATVNGSPVSKGEYDRALQAYLRNVARVTGGMQGQVKEPSEQMKADVLEQLVDRELLYQESKKFPWDKSAEETTAELEKIKARFPDEAAFQKALASDNLTEAALKDLVGRQVSVRHYVGEEISPKVKVTDEDVAKFYKENEDKFAMPEQVHCSHILIRVAEDAKAEEKDAARKKTEAIRERCVKGEDFAALAKELSEDPGSAAKGGDLGFFAKQQMVAPFADAAFALKPDEISPVVETRFGYHIIKLHERKAASKRSLDEVKDQIQGYLQTQALDQAVQAKVQELKANAKIDVVAPHL